LKSQPARRRHIDDGYVDARIDAGVHPRVDRRYVHRVVVRRIGTVVDRDRIGGRVEGVTGSAIRGDVDRGRRIGAGVTKLRLQSVPRDAACAEHEGEQRPRDTSHDAVHARLRHHPSPP
jgi:hypothetical protein